MVDHAPASLSELSGRAVAVRIVCRLCAFEEDWSPAGLALHLAQIGGSEVWLEITRHLRCRSFGCGSTDLIAQAVPTTGRSANMKRRVGRFDAHVLAIALAILEAAVQRSRGQAVATMEVRLALLVVHRYAQDSDCVRHFWSRASTGNRSVDDGLAEPLKIIRQRLVSSGWLAPVYLVEPGRIWPWNSPAPPGWRSPDPD